MLIQKDFGSNGNVVHRPKKQTGRDFSNSEDNYSFFIYSVPCILAVICYCNSLLGDFVHDDIFAIKNNGDVTGANSIGQIWHHDFWGHPMNNIASHKSYRPLTTLSFRLDYYLSPVDPLWFHVVNIALHALVTCLLARVFLHVLQTTQLCALLASCLFAVHPIHAEAVSGIVGRADILAALFFLLSFLAYTRCTECLSISKDNNDNTVKCYDVTYFQLTSLSYLLTSLLFAVAGTLCKETGITVLGVCFLYDVIKHRGGLMTFIRFPDLYHCRLISPLMQRLVSLVLTAVLILIGRAWVMNFQLPIFQEEDNPASYSTSFITRFLTFNYLLPFNLWLLLCPSLLCYDWQVGSIPLLESLTDYRNIYTLMFYLLGLLLIRASWYDLTKKISDETESDNHTGSTVPVLPMAVVLLILPFLPASNLFFPVGFVVAERVLYIPSMGFCLLIALGVSKLSSTFPRSKGHFLTFLLVLILILAARTWNRNKVWKTRHSLFWSGVQTLPMNAKVHYNMANLYKDTGDIQGAIQHYKRAVELYPTHASYHNNLGTLLSDFHEAEYHFRKALSLVPNHKGAMVNLGNLLIDHRNSSGMIYLKHALEIDPDYIDAILSLGKAMISIENFSEAEDYIRRAIKLKPDLAEAHNYYGVLFKMKGQFEHAVSEFQKAFKLNTQDNYAMKNAAISLQLLGRYEEAEEMLKRAVSLKGDTESYLLLGALYSQMGNSLESLFAFREAVTIAPNDTAVNLKYIKALIDSNQHQEAEQSLTQLLLKDPHNFDVLKFAYMCADKNGNTKQALHYAHEALIQAKASKSSAVGSVYNDVANLYRKLSDLDKSLQYFKLSIEADSTLVKSHINIGTIYHIKKDYAKAEKFYLQALTLNPENEIAKRNLKKLRKVWKKG